VDVSTSTTLRMVGVAETAERKAERKRLAREAERRRGAVTVLQISECTCRYAASQIGNGASPAEARETALFAAAELAAAAEALRRAVRLRPDQRRMVARLLAGKGMSTKQIAAACGVSETTVRHYLHGRRARGAPAAVPR
jgi:DNA-directed RNA polymerase specialized sigma24 family protein